MLCRSAYSNVLLARAFKHSKCLIQTCNKSRKSDGSPRIKRLRKEDKMFYGKLIETKKEKVKRIKLEKKGILPKPIPSTIDSEYAWVSGSSVRLQVLQLHTNIVKQIHGTAVKLIIKNDNKKSKTENSLLPKDVYENLFQYSIYENSKNSDDKWNDDCEIMTVSQNEDKSCLKYPSVTNILTATMSEDAKNVLKRWKEKMIKLLGVKGFEIYQKALFADGKMLHATIMNKLIKKPYEVPDKIEKSFLSLNKVFEDIDKVRALESHVIHPTLMYRGIVDCVASYRGDLCLIDWKKSDSKKPTLDKTYDAPLQLASYIGALNADSKYPFKVKKGIIVVAYTDGTPADVHEINEESLNTHWKYWLYRLQSYHNASNSQS